MRMFDASSWPAQNRPPGGCPAPLSFTRLVLELSERQPVVICVDDMHNADPESVSHLLRLVRRLHSARVLAVFTERTRPVTEHSVLRTELLRQPHVRSLRLGLLSQRGVL
jgi:predicted ATPase